MRERVHNCCPVAEQCIHYSVVPDNIKGPRSVGWCLIVADWANDPYFVNIDYCPFCGNKFNEGGKDFDMSSWENEIRKDEKRKCEIEIRQKYEQRQSQRQEAVKNPVNISVNNNVPSCPSCGGEMVKRYSSKTGDEFWGCYGFPECRGTRPLRG